MSYFEKTLLLVIHWEGYLTVKRVSLAGNGILLSRYMNLVFLWYSQLVVGNLT